ncbi:Putative flippase GtrA (transmembrane translocase of bactoprenol-linked glucose) [Sporobacter termitidis DSM 10068]|uniref:Putative flippase GtrA (Transmembrane translocase of bactoprenol-linked glucose) n=1 Tax=Sporobacter termitidis DSM 10068 TaxID=1123282 RepID=A0A1M5Z9G3_9FIRM|nr:GtrA family protein [Sporobacter termitidis]SHI20860.1 Putative flippase GtrA (transmembrane translocase of bactoprenol-linked glucose) [Sporobacter termitidis DSM 10068]
MAEKPTQALTAKQYAVQFIKFTLFSISAGVIQILSFTALGQLTALNYWPKYLVALVLSVLYNFTLNRRFTFRSVTNFPLAMIKVAGYYAVFTPLSTWWGDKLTGRGWNEFLVLFGTMVINFITEFLFDRFVVFRNSINTNEQAQRQTGTGASNTD